MGWKWVQQENSNATTKPNENRTRMKQQERRGRQQAGGKANKRGPRDIKHLLGCSLLVCFFPSISFFVTNKLFKLLTRTPDHADDDRVMKPTQHSPHIAASTCLWGESQVIDNNSLNDVIQNPPYLHHRCGLGEGY